MKPLHAVALGIVLLALGPTDADPGVFDPLPDPLGWVLVLIGLHGLRGSIDQRRLPVLRVLGAAALAVSIALVVPAAARWVATDPSLGWWADVPRFSFFAVLCYLLSAAALQQKSTIGAAGFNLCALALLFVLAAPPIAFGGGVDAVGTAGEIAAEAVQIALVILCVTFAGREWGGAPVETDPAAEAEPEGGSD